MTFFEQGYTSADFNGDGLTDIMGIAPVRIPTGPNSWAHDTYAYVYHASLDNYGRPVFTTGENYRLEASFDLGDWKEQHESASAIDFDGDGINEFIVPHSSISKDFKQILFYVYSNTITRRFTYDLKSSNEMPLYATGDFNNDGKGDLIYMEKGHSGNLYPGEIVGSKGETELYRAAFNLQLPSSPVRIFTSDFNGNGLQDLLVFYAGGYTIFWNQGNGISTSSFSNSKKTTGTNIEAVNKWHMVREGDFNGDGLADFILNRTDEKEWYFALNNGNGTFSKTVACSLAIHDQSLTDKDDDKFTVLVYDFDGDGKSDVVMSKSMYWKHKMWFGSKIKFDKTYTYWMRSDGIKLSEVKKATSTRDDDAHPTHYLSGDFNGDGTTDMINLGYNCYSGWDANNEPVWRFYKSGVNVSSGKVVGITDGYDAHHSVAYASFANDGFYQKGSGSAYPVVDYRIPIHAVKSASVYNNGAAGSETVNYQYGGLKIHLQGKGMLGLSLQRTSNTTTGTSTESGVKTWNTTFHIPSATYARTTVDGKTAETTTTLAIADKGAKKYFAYPSSKTDKDLDGNTTTTTCKFNTTYGYLEEEKVDFGSNMYKTVQYGNYVLAGKGHKPQLITQIQKHADDNAAFIRKTAITYDTGKGLKLKVTGNQGTSLALTTDFTYDTWGNVLTSQQTGQGIGLLTRHFTYDATKRFVVKKHTVPASSVTSFTYDRWGNIQTEKDETQTGNILTTTHTYDGWGNLISSVYPDGSSTTTQKKWSGGIAKCFFVLTESTGQPWVKTWYDNRGREVLVETVGKMNMLISRQTTYDNKGQVIQIQSNTGDISVTENYTYDARGRVASFNNSAGQSVSYSYGNRTVSTTTNGRTYKKTHDAWGALKSSTDPQSTVAYTYKSSGAPARIIAGGATFSMEYDAVGNQTKLVDPNAGTITYAYDAAGRITKQTDGNGKVTATQYDDLGRIASTTTGGIATTYAYGTAGYALHRLVKVQTGNNAVEYDNADRLTIVKHGNTTAMSIGYSANGNISSKTGVGQYGYGSKPHAVTSVENRGNLISHETQQITYTAFNKVARIAEQVGADNLVLDFSYGPDRQRWKTILQKNGKPERTAIFAGDYEAITQNGQTRQLYYIAGADGVAAVYVKQAGQADKIYYPHTDHLGSLVKLTDGNGTEVFKAAYDAWGNQTVTDNTFAFHRGYTGHEHLPWFGLIDMNGRMYDPVLGRFSSPDPYVQLADFSQNYNRYSYCLNNPMRFTDPNGELFVIDDLIIAAAIGAVINVGIQGMSGNINSAGDFFLAAGIGAFSGAIGSFAGQAVAGALGTATTLGGSIANGALIGASGGLAGGFVGGTGNAWMNGANFGQGLKAGLISGGISAGIGGVLGGISGGYSYYKNNLIFQKGNAVLGVEPSDAVPATDKFLSEAQQAWYPDAPMKNIEVFTVENVPRDVQARMQAANAPAATRARILSGKFTGNSEVYFNGNIAFSSAKQLFYSMGHEFIHVSQYAALMGQPASILGQKGFKDMLDFHAYNYQNTLGGTKYSSFARDEIRDWATRFPQFKLMSHINFPWTNNVAFRYPLH